ncbi:MAG: hypothetical protein F3745_07200 [Nitrospinae bacterium]|nr:hypothetical protein [Nitrospinota bacterium]
MTETGMPTKDAEALFMSREELGRSPAGVDKPAERLEDDLLGRKNDVKALAEMIADEKQGTPFTIGLLGRWGEGKSTVMHMLKDALEKRKDGHRFKFAKFNAWEYERTSNLSAGLAQEVTRSLIEPLGFWDEWRLRFEFALREHKYKALTPIISLLMITYLGLLGVFISMWVNPNTGMGENWWYEGIFASFFSLPLAFWYYFKKLSEHPLSVELSTYLRLPSYGEHLGLIPVLKRHIATLCQIRLGTNKERNNNRKEVLGMWDSLIFEKNLEREDELPHRLVVFIDDLDRCDPSSITKTLDAVRLVMDVENVIVVIGIDHRIAFRAVGEHYKDLADGKRSQQDIARDYLGKIFQLAIMLDRPQNEELKSFVSEFLFPDAKLDIAKKEQEAAGQELHIKIEDRVEIEDQVLDIEIEEGQEENLWREEIKFTTKERDLFGELAVVFEFSNPRQLLRLRNSYGLLKLLYGMHGAISFTPYYKNLDSGEVKPKLLILLFWKEFEANHPKWAMQITEPVENSRPEPIAARIYDWLSKSDIGGLNFSLSGLTEMATFVERFVLPRGEEDESVNQR